MKRRVLLAVLPVIALVALAGVGDAAPATPGAGQTTKGQPWTGSPGVTVSTADLMARQRYSDWGLAGDPGSGKDRTDPHEEPAEPHGPPKGPGKPTKQTRVGEAAIGRSSALTEGTNFLGAHRFETPANFRPPDSMGAVGPTQVLVIVNGRIRVFDKDGTNSGVLDMTDSQFWDPVRGGLDVTDPQVEYDRLSGRWILSQINFDPNNDAMVDNRIMVAVSDSATITPTTNWTYHFFTQNEPNPAATARFADYPQMGVDANAIYIGTNEFSSSGPFTGTTAYVIRKSTAMTGGPLTVTAFRNLATATGAGPFTPQPATDMEADVDHGYIVGVDNATFSRLDVRRITDPGGTPTISGNLVVNVPTTRFPDACGQEFCVPAQGSNKGLDALDDRLFEAMIGRDENGTLSLWTAHNIEVNASGVASTSGGRDGARWYQLGDLSGTPDLVQSGTLFDSASTNPRYFWIPSIAMNGQGHASLNASTAGTGRFAGIASSAHLASDPIGTTEPFDEVQTGVSYGNTDSPSPSRWGDYSQTVVDPTDNQTFWTFQEYAFGDKDWGLRVVKVLAPPPAAPTTASPTPIDLGQASVSVLITGTSANGSGFFDPGPDFDNRIEATVTGPGDVTVNSVTYDDPTHVTLDLDTTLASDGSQDVTITNPDGQAVTGENILVTGTDVTPPNPPTLTGTIPASPANNNAPRIFGTAEGGSLVRLYTNPGCSGIAAAAGSAAQFASGLAVSVPDNSTTTFYGTARDISNNTSDCSSTLPSSVTYVERTPPAPTPTPTPAGGGGAVTAPQTKITKGPKKTRKRRPKFKFVSSEAGSTFLCKLDRKKFKPCSSPFRPRKKLKPGKHKLKVKAVDPSGNADSTPAIRKFKVLPSKR